MKKLFNIIFLSFITLSILMTSVVKAEETVNVVTTFYPMYFLADRIGGDDVNVSLLLDKGQDAHSYESTARDVVTVQESDLFIYQDDEMEFFVQDLLSVVDTDKTYVLESTQGLELLEGEGHDEHGHEDEHDHEEGHSHEYDPHTWLDPAFYSEQALNVRDALIEVDPANAEHYEANAQQLVDELLALDQEFEEGLQSLSNRTMVVQHEAFGYLAHAYDLKQVAITGLMTNTEPSAQQLVEISKFIAENNVETIYIDPATSTSISEAVADTTGVKLRPLRTLESVSTEEMEQGIDYLSIMRDNLNQLIGQ
ncbi:metal ABC transporter solute-binding protein, Zn/Mn family [Aerococcaceae bacterium WGS1372]